MSIVRLQPVRLKRHDWDGFTGIPIMLKAFGEDPRIDPVPLCEGLYQGYKELEENGKFCL